MFGAWGLLPIAAVLVWFVSQRLTRLVFADAGFRERVAGAIVIGLAVVHVSVGVLGTFGLISTGALLGVLSVAALVLAVVTRRRLPAVAPTVERGTWVVLGAIGVVAALAATTARILPIWQWDSVGYHLPFVHFVLQSGGFAGVPADLRYTSTYPHNVELSMIFLRAMLPDDRLVDLSQLPFGLAGAALCAVIARHLGARQPLAVLAGAAWLVAPGVFLQLPTNYVDVGTATALLAAVYFLLLRPVSARALLVGGLALGLFLGSKPSAPLATAFIGALVVLRGARAGEWRALALFALLVVLFGGEMYLVMLARHGNPVWPVQVHLGPLTLPGESSVDDLLSSGAAHPRAGGSLLVRLAQSWLAVQTAPVFDMRTGGYGLLFLLALPAALVGLVRRRSGWLLLALAACLCSPDPSMSRYVLAFAALVFALAFAELSRLPARGAAVLVGLVLAVGAEQLVQAWPGLTGDGPAWSAFWSMSDADRREALGPDGRPEDYAASWSLVGQGESAAFDSDFELPGLIWAPRMSYPVHCVPMTTGQGLDRWLAERNVRLLAVGPAHRAIIDAEPEAWEKLFDCHSEPCAVYVRR
jgi:hypothetical protein